MTASLLQVRILSSVPRMFVFVFEDGLTPEVTCEAEARPEVTCEAEATTPEVTCEAEATPEVICDITIALEATSIPVSSAHMAEASHSLLEPLVEMTELRPPPSPLSWFIMRSMLRTRRYNLKRRNILVTMHISLISKRTNIMFKAVNPRVHSPTAALY